MGGSMFVESSGASTTAAAARLAEVRSDGADIQGACHRACRDIRAAVQRRLGDVDGGASYNVDSHKIWRVTIWELRPPGMRYYSRN